MLIEKKKAKWVRSLFSWVKTKHEGLAEASISPSQGVRSKSEPSRNTGGHSLKQQISLETSSSCDPESGGSARSTQPRSEAQEGAAAAPQHREGELRHSPRWAPAQD